MRLTSAAQMYFTETITIYNNRLMIAVQQQYYSENVNIQFISLICWHVADAEFFTLRLLLTKYITVPILPYSLAFTYKNSHK